LNRFLTAPARERYQESSVAAIYGNLGWSRQYCGKLAKFLFWLLDFYGVNYKKELESELPELTLEIKMVERKKTYLDLKAEAEELLRQAAELREKEVEAVIEDIKEKIRSYGITAHDLGFTPAKIGRTARKTYVRVKYRGPNGEEWSGRGLTPKWLKEAVANGKSKEDFTVN
jgi:DNA-binding protein H-NS